MTDRNEGCLIAAIGGVIAVGSIVGGIFGWLGEATYEHWGAAQAFFWLALGGGVVGLTIFFGALLPWGNPHPKPKLPEYRRCSNCAVENFLWAEYCQFCGKPLGFPRSADKSGGRCTDSTGRQECPVCHVTNADSRMVCVFCGNPLEQTTSDPPRSTHHLPR